MIKVNTNTICANQAWTGMLLNVMTALWLLIPFALVVLAPLLTDGDLPYREKRGSWRNYR
jgi:hypothetical protein